MRSLLPTCLLGMLAATAGAQDPSLPAKYGPQAIRLYHARQHVQTQPAPDFWALIPYYAAQPDEQSCSAASVAMLVNAFRADRQLGADQELATPAGVVDKVDASLWKNHLAPDRHGVTLDQLGQILPPVLAAYQIAAAHVQVLRWNEQSPTTAAEFRQILQDNERSQRDLLLVNFLQSVVTGDPDGAVGHLAPVAAHDAQRSQVLLLDPDRRWYEPYWVPEAKLLEALMTKDPRSGKNRGLIRITIGDTP
jgi:hypothetical protein